VEEHDADVRVRRLSTKSQFLALLYGQLSGASSQGGFIESFRSDQEGREHCLQRGGC
jgi:hypothetical protein